MIFGLKNQQLNRLVLIIHQDKLHLGQRGMRGSIGRSIPTDLLRRSLLSGRCGDGALLEEIARLQVKVIRFGLDGTRLHRPVT